MCPRTHWLPYDASADEAPACVVVLSVETQADQEHDPDGCDELYSKHDGFNSGHDKDDKINPRHADVRHESWSRAADRKLMFRQVLVCHVVSRCRRTRQSSGTAK